MLGPNRLKAHRLTLAEARFFPAPIEEFSTRMVGSILTPEDKLCVNQNRNKFGARDFR